MSRRLRNTTTVRLQRQSAGSYTLDHPSRADAYYQVERGWADDIGTDRRRQTWVLAVVTSNDRGGDADILSDHPTLTSARDEIERLLAHV